MKNYDSQKLTKTTIKRIILVAVLVAVFFTATMFLLKHFQNKVDKEILINEKTNESYEEETNLVRYEGKWYKQNPKLETLLLIGVDDVQSDFLLLLAIDQEAKTYNALQINRDTMTDVPQLDMYDQEYGSKYQQIALAHTHGNSEIVNCNNTVKAVSKLLYGVEIDHFICAPMDIVPVANDLVGGVSVFVEDDFLNTDPSIVQGETVTLMGDQALKFVRARGEMEDPTNLARMERQRAYMTSFHRQAIEKAQQSDDFIFNSLLELNSYITSDCSIYQMADFFDVALSEEGADILTIKGEAIKGEEYVEYHVDEKALQKQIIDLFFVEEER